ECGQPTFERDAPMKKAASTQDRPNLLIVRRTIAAAFRRVDSIRASLTGSNLPEHVSPDVQQQLTRGFFDQYRGKELGPGQIAELLDRLNRFQTAGDAPARFAPRFEGRHAVAGATKDQLARWGKVLSEFISLYEDPPEKRIETFLLNHRGLCMD